MPASSDIKQEMLDMLSTSDAMSAAGFGYLSGNRMGVTSAENQPESSDQDRRSKLESELQQLEDLIQKHGGPFIFG